MNLVKYISIFITILLLSCTPNTTPSITKQKNTDGEQMESTPEDDSRPNFLYSYEVDQASTGYAWRQRIVDPIEEPEEISKELLVQTIWIPENPDLWPIRVVFFLDDVVIGGSIQGGESFRGTYEIVDGKLHIRPTIMYGDWWDSKIKNDEKIIYSFDPSYTGLWYTGIMTSEDIALNLQPAGYQTSIGSELNLQGHSVIKLDSEKWVVVKQNLFFRSGPGLQYDSYSGNIIYGLYPIFNSLPNNSVKYPPYLMPGHTLRTFAKTTTEETIQCVTGHWLYVRDGNDEYSNNGWVFEPMTISLNTEEGKALEDSFAEKLESFIQNR